MIDNLVLVGSRALAFRAPEALNRRPLDFDFICSGDACREFLLAFGDKVKSESAYSPSKNKIIVKGKSIIEFEISAPNSSTESFIELVKKDDDSLRTDFGLIPHINLLFTLKKSHRYVKSPHFYKTFCDYHKLKAAGCKSDKYNDWLKLRETETYATQKYPKLNMGKKEFFDENTFDYKLQHDDIHEALANELLGGFGKPTYKYYGEPGEEVKSSKKIFFECAEEIQIRGCIEEVMVLACERSLYPFPNKLTERQAYLLAYEKLASGISSGWFREFLYENGPQVIAKMPIGYYDHFLNCVANGSIRKFEAPKEKA